MMQLQKPQLKVKEHILRKTKEVNLPIPLSQPSVPWPNYEGVLIGTTVVVNKIEDAAILNSQGSFGKCVFSRAWSTPNQHSILRKRQWDRRKIWQSKCLKYNSTPDCSPAFTTENFTVEMVENSNPRSGISHEQSNQKNTSSKAYNTTKPITPSEVLVVNDSDEEYIDAKTFMSKLNPILHKEKIKTIEETLCLNLEEAFFLCYALHCMTITLITSNNVLKLDELWKLFINAEPKFVERYITYHYFRSKGWIVKSGLNFGCDFAIYKRGPAYHHASCVVKIRNIHNSTKPILSWEHMMGYCRVSEAAKKNVVLCEITWPRNITANTCDITDISRFIVAHKILQRWTASEHRG